jgi:pimeloyl-ACP methyl ester carboxylesterase
MTLIHDTKTTIEEANIVPQKFCVDQFTSRDGTLIKYGRLGQGPGLIILAGGLQTAQDYLPLAAHLADRYTVYATDRRGRNGSGPQGKDYTIEKECEDAITLLEKTQTSFLFGHSYGGLIALNVARQYPLTKIALYEPAVSINGSIPSKCLLAYERSLAKEDYLGALVTMIQGLQLGGKMNWLPSPPFKLLAKFFVDKDGLDALAKVLRALPRESREAFKLDSDGGQYAEVLPETLLMAGSESPAFLHQAVRTLETILPNSKRVLFLGLDHAVPNEAPEKIAPTLMGFFG